MPICRYWLSGRSCHREVLTAHPVAAVWSVRHLVGASSHGSGVMAVVVQRLRQGHQPEAALVYPHPVVVVLGKLHLRPIVADGLIRFSSIEKTWAYNAFTRQLPWRSAVKHLRPDTTALVHDSVRG